MNSFKLFRIEPLASWNTFLLNLGYRYYPKLRKKVFSWSEVHSYRSDFLQNPVSVDLRVSPI